MRWRAMTLIEVVAGLALMASVLTGILAVKGRCVHQARVTERRQQAIAAADAMLSAWWADHHAFPVGRAGRLADSPIGWRLLRVPNPRAESLGAQVVRLEMTDASEESDRPCVSVEVLVPAEQTNETGVHPH